MNAHQAVLTIAVLICPALGCAGHPAPRRKLAADRKARGVDTALCGTDGGRVAAARRVRAGCSASRRAHRPRARREHHGR